MKKKDYLEEIYGTATEESFYQPIAVAQTPTATRVDVQQLAQHLSLLLQQPQQQHFATATQGGAATDSSTPPINLSVTDLFPEAQQQAKELLQYVSVRKHQFPEDKHTILHFSFKNGEPKRYTRDRIDWFVKHYEEKVAIAEEEEVSEEAAINRKSKLLYWLERQRELYDKLGVATA